MHRICQIGLGPLGRRILTDLYRRGLGEVLAVVDPALAGKQLSDFVEGAPAGIEIVASLDEVANWNAIRCTLVTTLSDLELCMDTFTGLLTRGQAVISTCEELSWPWLRHPVLASTLHELAIKHDARLLGTGVNPGFLMDLLPVVGSTLCEEVSSMKIERIQEASQRRLPFQDKIGATLSTADFGARVKAGSLRHVGLGESLHAVAHYMGMQVARWEESIEPVIAEQALDCGLGPIPAGHACGVHQEARAWDSKDKLLLELIFHAAIGTEDPRDAIHISGTPELSLLIPGGVHGDTATSAVVLNSIRPLLGAERGLHTMSSLPTQGCAPRPSFAAR